MARRPTPEELLEQVQKAEVRESTGRLKIFLGYASGVGKSSHMLDEGCRRAARGQDVIMGATQSSAPDVHLEVIPLLHGGAMDVPAILKRRPRVCLVDGLAWENPPTASTFNRWEDVRDLLAAGISIIASINIQYVTELRERVERITGKHVTPTVPQSFLYGADEIVVVDAPPEQLHLAELREIALLLAADIVDRQLEDYLKQHGITGSYGTQERILMCMTPRSSAQSMIASGRHIAERFHGELIAVHVRQPDLGAAAQIALNRNLALAREAGADVELLDGDDPIESILEFARERGITQIFIGHGQASKWWHRWTGDAAGQLIRGARNIDVRIFPQ